MSNFMKIRPVSSDLFHSGGRIDMTKLPVDFHNFAKGLKSCTQFRNFCCSRYIISYIHGNEHKVTSKSVRPNSPSDS
jgi:hypothetical protein